MESSKDKRKRDYKDKEEDGTPPVDGLQRFPDFSREMELSKESAEAAARMGIPHWLAYPTKVDRDLTIPINDPRLNLSDHTIARCKKAGLESLFAVQAAVIPVLRAAHAHIAQRDHVRDLCVSAPTGSGKTLAFAIPIIEQLQKRVVVRLRALIVLPTKDLAQQVKECFDFFCGGTGLRVGLASGDISLVKEQAMLTDPDAPDTLAGGSSRVDILVCTPGRLMDHLTQTANFTLQHLQFWVMDEADRLLAEAYHGWLDKIQASIESACTKETSSENGHLPVPDAYTRRDPAAQLNLLTRPPPRIQKLLFSATLTQDPAKLARLKLVRPLYVSVISDQPKASYTFPSTLSEFYLSCSADEKPLWLIYLLWQQQIRGAVCFAKSLEAAHRLAQVAQAWASAVPSSQWSSSRQQAVVAEYSSDLPAPERSRIMRLFKQGDITLLVCSDLIARGLDIDQIATVINYDVPTHMNQYTHRVGRTARAGKQGSAYTLVADTQMHHFKKMMKESSHWGSDRVVPIRPEKQVLESLRSQYEKALEKVGVIYN